MELIGRNRPLKERKILGSFFGKADLVRGPHPWVGGNLKDLYYAIDLRKPTRTSKKEAPCQEIRTPMALPIYLRFPPFYS